VVVSLEDALPARRRRQIEPIVVLIVTSWLVVVVPRLLNSILSEKHRTSVGDSVAGNPLVSLTQRGLNFFLLGVCVWIVVTHFQRLPTDRRLALVIMIAPWVFMLSRDLYVYGKPKVIVLLYPMLILAVWTLRPQLEKLRLIAWLTAGFAVLNLGLAVALPTKGLFTSAVGDLIAPDKEILSWGILVGIFTNGNNLGVFLVLAVPAVALLRQPVHRVWITALVAFCLLWTSSRSSLGALAAMLAVFLVLATLRASGRGVASAVVLLVTAAAIAAMPLTSPTNDAYTNRGYIWRTSLGNWSREPWMGAGSKWYDQIGQYVNALPGTAFHGHNLFVHALVTGGIVYTALLTVVILCLIYYAIVWAIRGVSFPTAYVTCLLVSCTLEVPFGVVDNGYLFALTALPMAVIVFAPLPANTLTPEQAGATSITDLRVLNPTIGDDPQPVVHNVH
jgi:O-antigen ligase/polysaccharide polymerase Wzy-like membrane protein